MHEVRQIWLIVFNLESRFENHDSGKLALDAMLWIPCFGLLLQNSLLWVPHAAFLVYDHWLWAASFEFLVLYSRFP